ncbi:MAG TPA: hypothetical protein VJB12_01065, partial [Candidatus Nanoarchaeia archaeon]|nr:hypothetical protein [Candidatus Nanoarchaeia archaeon]
GVLLMKKPYTYLLAVSSPISPQLHHQDMKAIGKLKSTKNTKKMVKIDQLLKEGKMSKIAELEMERHTSFNSSSLEDNLAHCKAVWMRHSMGIVIYSRILNVQINKQLFKKMNNWPNPINRPVSHNAQLYTQIINDTY